MRWSILIADNDLKWTPFYNYSDNLYTNKKLKITK